ncbi:sugar phosphate isomerase/epimerase family protein [Algoriphagus sp. A40]|uniref:sugar phosphate isomerase/epimerase family protein n=1 Tax=Algoriphagus sp. A40 TaxID=1945863 RepID=UPI0009876C28|nr:sugar phosphate isomerase/epimerase family protein [Algoriphagus sp. A40]OOG73050.1 sugar phosphate isomerase [Algoriphagus sp. A40]
MIRSAVTIALVPQLKSGPWIFWEDLEQNMQKAASLGFDGVELFTASADAIDKVHLGALLEKYQLQLAAVGTGAGKVIHGLTLTDPDPDIRKKAISFISDMISFGAKFGSPTIIGSMQGNVLPSGNREETMSWLGQGLEILGKKAESEGIFLIYEPLNRYETNLLNTLEAGSAFLDKNGLKNIKLLADLFHMNIEEADLPESIRTFGKYIGHVHFADSNRKPMGLGHTDMQQIADALKEIGYAGYVSAEAFPFPNPDSAAERTIQAFRKYFR